MPCLRNASISESSSCIHIDHETLTSSSRCLGCCGQPRPDGSRSVPKVDGPDGFLPELPSRLITAGSFSKVDFIGGHCTNDGRTFVGGQPSDFVTDEDVATRVFSRWGDHIVC